MPSSTSAPLYLKSRKESIIAHHESLLDALINFTSVIIKLRKELPPYYQTAFYIQEEYLPQLDTIFCSNTPYEEYAIAVVKGIYKFLTWQYTYHFNLKHSDIQKSSYTALKNIEHEIDKIHTLLEELQVFEINEMYIKKIYALSNIEMSLVVPTHAHAIKSEESAPSLVISLSNQSTISESSTLPIVASPGKFSAVSPISPTDAKTLPADSPTSPMVVAARQSAITVQAPIASSVIANKSANLLNTLLILMDSQKQVQSITHHNYPAAQGKNEAWLNNLMKDKKSAYAVWLKSNKDRIGFTESYFHRQEESLTRRAGTKLIPHLKYELPKIFADQVASFKQASITNQSAPCGLKL